MFIDTRLSEMSKAPKERNVTGIVALLRSFDCLR